MWTSQVLTQFSLFGVLTCVLSIEIKNLRHHIHSNDPKTFNEHNADPNTFKECIVDFKTYDGNIANPQVDNEPLIVRRAGRVDRSAGDSNAQRDKEFARELRNILRDTRATYAGTTRLMNRVHTTAKKKLFVQQDKLLMERGVNSEQVEQLLKSSEELARDGTRLPLWGVATDGGPTPKPPTFDMIRELRELLRDSRATYATTKLMNRQHTTAKRKMFVQPDQVLLERGVNSEQLAEIIKSSEERNPEVVPLIGMTTPNYTVSTAAVDFIRELRAIFRDSRATLEYTTRTMNQAEYTSPRRKLKGRVDPQFGRYMVGSHQFDEILKSSEERANPSQFPLIGV